MMLLLSYASKETWYPILLRACLFIDPNKSFIDQSTL